VLIGDVQSCVLMGARAGPASGEASGGAAIVRPPGHHAESGMAMGFCFFCNAALAARAAQVPPRHQQSSWHKPAVSSSDQRTCKCVLLSSGVCLHVPPCVLHHFQLHVYKACT